jgi:hypothetical protein
MERISNLVGMTFGRLTVLKYYDKTKSGNKRWECQCSCGLKSIVAHGDLRSGHTKSCGCLGNSATRPYRVKHGLSKHLLRGVWNSMNNRCHNPKSQAYPWYGAKGVRVCDEWRKNIISFYDWCIENGWHEGMEVDKDIIPKKLGIPAVLYSPEMCSIVTKQENLSYSWKKAEVKGVVKSVSEWAKELGISKNALYARIKKLGWSREKAFTEPKVTPVGFPKKNQAKR